MKKIFSSLLVLALLGLLLFNYFLQRDLQQADLVGQNLFTYPTVILGLFIAIGALVGIYVSIRNLQE